MSETKTHIGLNPPDNRNGWECQCARCGSSMTREECENCGGDGVNGHDCGEDCCCCLYPEDNVPCDICNGEGGWWACLSRGDWCKSHPQPGREEICGSTPEWFYVGDEND